jgi:hypothetical protein
MPFYTRGGALCAPQQFHECSVADRLPRYYGNRQATLFKLATRLRKCASYTTHQGTPEHKDTPVVPRTSTVAGVASLSSHFSTCEARFTSKLAATKTKPSTTAEHGGLPVVALVQSSRLVMGPSTRFLFVVAATHWQGPTFCPKPMATSGQHTKSAVCSKTT